MYACGIKKYLSEYHFVFQVPVAFKMEFGRRKSFSHNLKAENILKNQVSQILEKDVNDNVMFIFTEQFQINQKSHTLLLPYKFNAWHPQKQFLLKQ